MRATSLSLLLATDLLTSTFCSYAFPLGSMGHLLPVLLYHVGIEDTQPPASFNSDQAALFRPTLFILLGVLTGTRDTGFVIRLPWVDHDLSTPLALTS